MTTQYSRIIALALAFLAVSIIAHAQEGQPTAAGTEQGIWIYLGNEIPHGFQYQILKKTGQGRFNVIGTTTYPRDATSMMAIIDENYPFFPAMEKPGDAEVSYLRGYAATMKTADSIYIPNFPLMHLALGTAFFDRDVENGQSYQYMVRKIRGGDQRADESVSNTVNYPESVDLLQPKFSEKHETSFQITLRWFVTEQRGLNFFQVYRRVFGLGDFEPVIATKGFSTSGDTIWMIVADSLITVPAIYEYYIVPMDIYGNRGPVSEVAVAGTTGGSLSLVPEYFNARGGESNHEVILSWKLSGNRYMRGIEVYRSFSYDDGYISVALLSAADSLYTDIIPVANENFYYYLLVKGPGETTYSTARVSAMFRNAGEKPLPPEEIDAETVPGGVKIYWSYYEPHARGFFVYRYVYETAEYMQISGLIPAGEGGIYSFIDSADYLLGNDIYRYAVRTVNDVELISDFSESASASPGIYAEVGSPVNPRITRISSGLMLLWDDLRDSESVLLGYKVYRRSNPDETWHLLPGDTLRADRNYYTDTLLTAGASYSYAVSAIDFYGNESAKSIPVTFITETVRFMSPSITGVVSTPEGIMLSWGQITDAEVTRVRIYRSQPGGESAVIATVERAAEQYLDRSAAEGELYIYEISLVTSDNREYEKSRGVSIRR